MKCTPRKIVAKWMSPLDMTDPNDTKAVENYLEAKNKAEVEEVKQVAAYNACVRKQNEEYNLRNPIIEYNGMYIRQSELREEFFRRKYIVGGGDNQDWTKYE